jgi:hypothetical protein
VTCTIARDSQTVSLDLLHFLCQTLLAYLLLLWTVALETFYTYSANTLKKEIKSGKYSQLRHFMYGSMGNHFEALGPQWVTAWNSLLGGPQYTWHKVSESAALPSLIPSTSHVGHASHSAFAQFSVRIHMHGF